MKFWPKIENKHRISQNQIINDSLIYCLMQIRSKVMFSFDIKSHVNDLGHSFILCNIVANLYRMDIYWLCPVYNLCPNKSTTVFIKRSRRARARAARFCPCQGQCRMSLGHSCTPVILNTPFTIATVPRARVIFLVTCSNVWITFNGLLTILPMLEDNIEQSINRSPLSLTSDTMKTNYKHIVQKWRTTVYIRSVRNK